ncbi:Ferric iron reductase protein FhuF, involved in iron transport [Halobacillus dabanensis]|uniref:Ferric iron reductase protein FhuF, involved in iron transport n=1 Tax=Halobacillus dabanensis TaxID=240302 RepID=A0A1I3TF01_HALDA|nr:IucA/IucC family C-terminal-domain containing protein [Halobacillus dabanensis]SFJ68241.1 Ferric iron reductase protein FhuF, involved in iron transport [Halobacillus dabanensis]
MNTTLKQVENDHKIVIGNDKENRVHFFADQLIQKKDTVKELLHIQTNQLEAPNQSITGLLFGKMYSVYTMGLFEILLNHGLIIDSTPANIGIELKEKNAMNYIVKEDDVHAMENLTEEEIKAHIYTFLVDHLQPLFQSVAQVSGCKSTHMRSIVSHNLHQRKCALMRTHENKKLVEIIFRWFTSQELFKRNTRNPLNFHFRYYKADNGKETYVRRHCCMKYMLHDADKSKCCPTCPLISDEERDDRMK